MAKKKMGWDFDDASNAAKSSIQKNSKVEPEKKKVGRPRAVESKTIQVQVSVEARDWAKKIAVMEGTTMIEYLTELILKDAKDRGYLK